MLVERLKCSTFSFSVLEVVLTFDLVQMDYDDAMRNFLMSEQVDCFCGHSCLETKMRLLMFLC